MMIIIYYLVKIVDYLFIKVVILFQVILTMDGTRIHSPFFLPFPSSQRSDLLGYVMCVKKVLILN
jgi:hypothetical protein